MAEILKASQNAVVSPGTYLYVILLEMSGREDARTSEKRFRKLNLSVLSVRRQENLTAISGDNHFPILANILGAE